MPLWRPLRRALGCRWAAVALCLLGLLLSSARVAPKRLWRPHFQAHILLSLCFCRWDPAAHSPSVLLCHLLFAWDLREWPPGVCRSRCLVVGSLRGSALCAAPARCSVPRPSWTAQRGHQAFLGHLKVLSWDLSGSCLQCVGHVCGHHPVLPSVPEERVGGLSVWWSLALPHYAWTWTPSCVSSAG